MRELEIKVYTTPSCGACKMLKGQVQNSEFAEKFEFIEITDENREYLRKNNINGVPAIHIAYNDREEFIVGYRPITTLDALIKEAINY